MDLNYQLGLFWGRIPELRFVYHPSKKAAFAIALDSPDQYAGGYGGAHPSSSLSALNTTSTYPGELDLGASSGGTIHSQRCSRHHCETGTGSQQTVHFEIGGIERNFKVYYPGAAAVAATGTTPAVAAIPSAYYSAEGGGGFVNLNVEVVKGLRLLTNNYWSDGGGRYIYGEAPDLIAHADGSISLVHSGSTVTGFEFTQKNTLLFGYYGGMYVMRNTAVDTNGNSSAGASRIVEQPRIAKSRKPRFGFNQTFWKNPKYGAVNIIGQYSYLTRDPWYVATGTPANANINMLFFDLRYTLPGSAPTLGRPAR